MFLAICAAVFYTLFYAIVPILTAITSRQFGIMSLLIMLWMIGCSDLIWDSWRRLIKRTKARSEIFYKLPMIIHASINVISMILALIFGSSYFLVLVITTILILLVDDEKLAINKSYDNKRATIDNNEKHEHLGFFEFFSSGDAQIINQLKNHELWICLTEHGDPSFYLEKSNMIPAKSQIRSIERNYPRRIQLGKHVINDSSSNSVFLVEFRLTDKSVKTALFRSLRHFNNFMNARHRYHRSRPLDPENY